MCRAGNNIVTIVWKRSKYYGSVASTEAETANWGLKIVENVTYVLVKVEINCQDVVI